MKDIFFQLTLLGKVDLKSIKIYTVFHNDQADNNIHVAYRLKLI